MKSGALAFVVFCLAPSLAFAQPRPQSDLCSVAPGAQPSLPAQILPGQGVTDMPLTTRSEEARRFFNQGVSQVHSFWFRESERSFLQAAALDPDMAMAYWGIALSAAGDYRPAFQLLRSPYEGGRQADSSAQGSGDEVPRTANGAAIDGTVRAREYVAKAMALADRVSERERLYIEAQAARRDPENVRKKIQDQVYIAGLRKLVAAYPDDLEAKAMLGLATLNGFDPVTREAREGTLEAIRLLEEVISKNDDHFGAHHYIIHGYEGSRMPEKAWYSCKRYPELVPNIPHALHMPGHIYAQSGKIDEAVASFAAAAKNELGWLERDVLYANGHHAHNVHFLIQALNLDGRFQESMERARQVMSFKETPREREGANQRVAYRQGLFALVKTLVRFERWDLILDGTTIPAYDRPEQKAWRSWAIGLAHTFQGELAAARESLDDLKKNVDQSTAAKEPLGIAVIELEGALAVRAGDNKRGWALLRKAASKEKAQLYTEPPAYPRPVVEGLGNLALLVGDYLTAERAFTEALEAEPGGGQAYFGLAAALEGLDRPDEAQAALDKAARAWDEADADLPQMQRLGGRHTTSGH